MWIAVGVSQLLIDAVNQTFRHGMFEVFGFRMDLVPGQTERFGEKQFDESMSAQDVERHLLAVLGEPGTTVGLVLDQARFGQPLQHRRDAAGSHLQALGDLTCRGGFCPGRGADVVDRLQVVFNFDALHAPPPVRVPKISRCTLTEFSRGGYATGGVDLIFLNSFTRRANLFFEEYAACRLLRSGRLGGLHGLSEAQECSLSNLVPTANFS